RRRQSEGFGRSCPENSDHLSFNRLSACTHPASYEFEARCFQESADRFGLLKTRYAYCRSKFARQDGQPQSRSPSTEVDRGRSKSGQHPKSHDKHTLLRRTMSNIAEGKAHRHPHHCSARCLKLANPQALRSRDENHVMFEAFEETQRPKT